MIQKWMLLGASRGLGKSFAERLSQVANNQIAIASRHPVQVDLAAEYFKMDFSKQEMWPDYLGQIRTFSPTRIVYFAGGGPFGLYGEKSFKDHQWAFKVNFEFPAFLLHQILSQRHEFAQVCQICLIGSEIADNRPDPKASSYSAAKHGLRGLVSSVSEELKLANDKLDLRLFSPGYMDTAMLPANAWPRQKGLAEDPGVVADNLLAILNSDSN